MIKTYCDEHYKVLLMVIRRIPYRNGYIDGEYIIEYFIQKPGADKILEIWEEINTNNKNTKFMNYVNYIPQLDNYSKGELLLYEIPGQKLIINDFNK